uniref:Uncharacterized protein n=1 Tax=Oryza rufipogon TaxID=4529 RepID=A0A0E0R7J4_ORYRU
MRCREASGDRFQEESRGRRSLGLGRHNGALGPPVDTGRNVHAVGEAGVDVSGTRRDNEVVHGAIADVVPGVRGQELLGEVCELVLGELVSEVAAQVDGVEELRVAALHIEPLHLLFCARVRPVVSSLPSAEPVHHHHVADVQAAARRRTRREHGGGEKGTARREQGQREYRWRGACHECGHGMHLTCG